MIGTVAFENEPKLLLQNVQMFEFTIIGLGPTVNLLSLISFILLTSVYLFLATNVRIFSRTTIMAIERFKKVEEVSEFSTEKDVRVRTSRKVNPTKSKQHQLMKKNN